MRTFPFFKKKHVDVPKIIVYVELHPFGMTSLVLYRGSEEFNVQNLWEMDSRGHQKHSHFPYTRIPLGEWLM
jgi:hypothetical protein